MFEILSSKEIPSFFTSLVLYYCAEVGTKSLVSVLEIVPDFQQAIFILGANFSSSQD